MSTFALGRMQVRRSGYGAMQLAGPYAFGPPPDRASAIGVLRAAVAAGVDHIDTAQYYGPGVVNDLIREALYPYPDGLAIVSKVAVRGDDGAVLRSGDPDQLRQGIQDNLRSLRVGQLAAVNLRLPGGGRVDARFDDQLAANLIMLGTGQQHWSTVHVADLADFFRRVLEDGSARGRYVIGNGVNPTVADLTEAAAVAVGAPGAVPGSDDEARARLGDYFAEVLLLDQGTVAAKARAELGWYPSHPSLVDEFRHGSYRK